MRAHGARLLAASLVLFPMLKRADRVQAYVPLLGYLPAYALFSGKNYGGVQHNY